MVLAKEGENPQSICAGNAELVSREGDESQLARPGVVVNAGIVCDVVGHELMVVARRDASAARPDAD